MNIDVQGASTLKRLEENGSFFCDKFHSVFIMPSSLNDLKQRLIKRGQDTYENIEKRIKTADVYFIHLIMSSFESSTVALKPVKCIYLSSFAAQYPGLGKQP